MAETEEPRGAFDPEFCDLDSALEIDDPIRPNSIGQAFTRLVKATGVPSIRLHDLRHTHASHPVSQCDALPAMKARNPLKSSAFA